MRRNSLFLIPILGLFLLFAAPANGAIKAGLKCSIKGQVKSWQSSKFVCTSVKGKLVWKSYSGASANKLPSKPDAKPSETSQSIAPALPSPNNSQSPQIYNFEPWSTEFETQLLIESALRKTNEYFGNVIPSNSYQLVVDPKISESDREWISKMLDYSDGAFGNVPREQNRIYLGNSNEWSVKAMKNDGVWIGDSSSAYPCSQGFSDAYCAQENLILLIYTQANSVNFRWDYGRRATPAHETFHTIQAALSGSMHRIGPENPLHIPRWLMEGSANFFGFYVSEKLNFDKYEVGRRNQVTLNPSYTKNEPLSNFDNFSSDPYGIGQAASEYLIASTSFADFLNIWRFTKSEQNFSKGFKKAIGIELSEFYQLFEKARLSMKIGSS